MYSSVAAPHIGVTSSSHLVEDLCPCPQEPCGLIAVDKVNRYCEQHRVERPMMQGHTAVECPGTS